MLRVLFVSIYMTHPSTLNQQSSQLTPTMKVNTIIVTCFMRTEEESIATLKEIFFAFIGSTLSNCRC